MGGDGTGPLIQRIDVADPHALGGVEQRALDALVDALEREALAGRDGNGNGSAPRPSPLEDEQRFPGLPAWMAMRRSTLALRPLLRPRIGHALGDGLAFSVFASPLWRGGPSPLQLLARTHSVRRAAEVVEAHRAFCETPTSRVAQRLFAGSADGCGVRQRSLVAARLLDGRCGPGARVAAFTPGADDLLGLVAASGAGGSRASVTLLDRDPMALAAARVRAEEALPHAQVSVALIDPARPQPRAAGSLRRVAPEQGWDVLDLVGIVECLPDPLAVDLVRAGLDSVRAGGVLLVSAMLDIRPQQAVLDHVVRWPRLAQRTAGCFLEVLLAAGAERSRITLAVGSRAPLYLVGAIEHP